MKKNEKIFGPTGQELIKIKESAMLPYVRIDLDAVVQNSILKNVDGEVLIRAINKEETVEEFKSFLIADGRYVSGEFVLAEIKKLQKEFKNHIAIKHVLTNAKYSWIENGKYYGIYKKIGVPLNYYCQELHMKMQDVLDNIEQKDWLYKYIYQKINGKLSKFERWEQLLKEVNIQIEKRDDIEIDVVNSKKNEIFANFYVYVYFPMNNVFLYQRLSNGKTVLSVLEEVFNAGDMSK